MGKSSSGEKIAISGRKKKWKQAANRKHWKGNELEKLRGNGKDTHISHIQSQATLGLYTPIYLLQSRIHCTVFVINKCSDRRMKV